MLKLVLKKSFFDIYDNFILILCENTIFFGLTFLLFFFKNRFSYFFIPLFLYFFLLSISIIIFINIIEENKKINIFRLVSSSLYISLIYGGIIFFGGYSLFYYLSMDNILFKSLGFLLTWIIIIFFIGSIYYYSFLKNNLYYATKSMKKSFVLFFDNIFITIILSFLSIVGFVLTPFIIFGLSFFIIVTNNTKNFIMKKYDDNYNPRKKVNWTEILKEERAILSHRKISIFPWK